MRCKNGRIPHYYPLSNFTLNCKVVPHGRAEEVKQASSLHLRPKPVKSCWSTSACVCWQMWDTLSSGRSLRRRSRSPTSCCRAWWGASRGTTLAARWPSCCSSWTRCSVSNGRGHFSLIKRLQWCSEAVKSLLNIVFVLVCVRSLYRDILFLSLVALGKDNIDIGEFLFLATTLFHSSREISSFSRRLRPLFIFAWCACGVGRSHSCFETSRAFWFRFEKMFGSGVSVKKSMCQSQVMPHLLTSILIQLNLL